ncbi:MAG: thermonuclease family protein [Myxococcota bacterium]
MLLVWLAASPLALADDPPTSARVVDVYDGDTFTLSNGDRVRLRGINTPEMKPPEPYALQAKAAASRMILNKTVTLHYSEPARDGYGRLLASIEVEGQDLATELIRQGYGHIFIIPPEQLDAAPMVAAQAEARAERRGIWKTRSYSGQMHITSFHPNAPGRDQDNLNGEYMRICNVSTEPLDFSGWMLKNRAKDEYTMPALTIPVGHTVMVFSGPGNHQDDPSLQLQVYLNNETPVWDNASEKAILYDTAGEKIDWRVHSVKDPSKVTD